MLGKNIQRPQIQHCDNAIVPKKYYAQSTTVLYFTFKTPRIDCLILKTDLLYSSVQPCLLETYNNNIHNADTYERFLI